MYWNPQPVTKGAWDESSREWELLWKLACHRGRVVGQGMLSNPDKHTTRSRRHRLSGLLAEVLELDALIETRRGQGYLLNLAAEKVVLLSRESQGRQFARLARELSSGRLSRVAFGDEFAIAGGGRFRRPEFERKTRHNLSMLRTLSLSRRSFL